MTDPAEPRPAESMPVQLTRMEGVLNSVAENVSDLRTIVDRHASDIADLKMSTQQLRSDAQSREETVVATAKALAEAKAAEEAAGRAAAAKAAAEAARSYLSWSPTMRTAALIGAVISVAGTVAASLALTLSG